MRSKEEIEEKIKEIEAERKDLLDAYKKSKFINEQAVISERNFACLEQIKLLKWILTTNK